MRKRRYFPALPSLRALLNGRTRRSRRKRCKVTHKTAGKNPRRSENVYSDNFHVKLLCCTRLLNKSWLVCVRFCISEAGAEHALRIGSKPAAAGGGRRWTVWVIYSVLQISPCLTGGLMPAKVARSRRSGIFAL